jgi:beta-lactamase class A
VPVDPDGRAGGAVPAEALAAVSLGGLVHDIEVPALPMPFAQAVWDPALEAAVLQSIAGEDNRYSVVVHNLADGRYAAVNPDASYYAASVYKLSVLREAFLRRDAGRLDFGEILTLDAEFAEYDSGTLGPLGLGAGSQLSVLDSIRAMIVVSDTPNAVMLQRLLGAWAIDESMWALGLEHTTFNDYALPTTAADMALLVTAIASGEGVSEASRLEMLALLMHERFGDGIGSGLAPGTPYGHKTGLAGDATHDVGIVWGPDGPYVISIFSDANHEWEPVAAVSAAVYTYFAQ